MSKKIYRVRNWKEYNKALVRRGSVTLWLDEASLDNWYEPKNLFAPRGRPQKYSDISIAVMLTLKQVYRLSLRSCQGFVESIIKMLEVSLDVPSYTQVCRRQSGIELPKLPVLKESIHLVIDASGLKVFGEGEWKVRQHGWSKRRTWRKLHIGVDEKSRLIVSQICTENNCSDHKKLPELVDQYEGDIYQISADGAYDSHECVDYLASQGVVATIPPQANPKHKVKTKEQIIRARDKIVWEVQELGLEKWKEASGYHRRSLVENAFYRYKQLTGDKLAARKLENQEVEALIRCHILNKMTVEGIPISFPI